MRHRAVLARRLRAASFSAKTRAARRRRSALSIGNVVIASPTLYLCCAGMALSFVLAVLLFAF